jgi:MraZ protein
MGSFQHALDEKGRVSLPASFRENLNHTAAPAIVLTNFICEGARCLDGFSEAAWKEFEAKIRSRSRFDPQARKLENYYLARAAHCPLDSSGRINIPTYLRTYASLDRDVTFTASMHGFRVWDTRVWEMVFREAESALLDDPSLFIGVDRE